MTTGTAASQRNQPLPPSPPPTIPSTTQPPPPHHLTIILGQVSFPLGHLLPPPPPHLPETVLDDCVKGEGGCPRGKRKSQGEKSWWGLSRVDCSTTSTMRWPAKQEASGVWHRPSEVPQAVTALAEFLHTRQKVRVLGWKTSIYLQKMQHKQVPQTNTWHTTWCLFHVITK